MTHRHAFALTAATALALLAAPLAALLPAPALALQQQRVQDFTLPPGPTPTPAPNVEGPVDDSGPVPVAPRAIPTATPTPTPTPTAEEAASPPPSPPSSPAPSPTPLPAATPPGAATDASPTPGERRASAPSPGPAQAAPATAGDLPAAGETEPPLPRSAAEPMARTGQTPLRATQQASSAGEGAPWPWGWLLALLAGILALALGAWWWRRRAAAAPRAIEPPLAANSAAAGHASAAGAGAPRLDTRLEVLRLTRSLMALTLKFRLTVTNRSDKAARELTIAADLASARRNAPVEQQLATGATRLPAIGKIARIGPHQGATLEGELQLPIDRIEVFQQGQVPLCVPLVRLRISGENPAPHLRTFVVGLGSSSPAGRVHPLPLSGPPGSYEGVRAKPLD